MSGIPRRRLAAFSAVFTLVVLLLAEALLRLAGFSYRPGQSYMAFNFPNPNELHNVFEPDPELLWRMRPGFEFGDGFEPLNSSGFRGPEFPAEKAPGALRVACLGDSVTFGRPEADYPSMIETRVSEKIGRPVETMNLGVPGYSSFQGKKLLARVLDEYDPEIAIILFGWNDHWLAKGFADQDQEVGEGASAGGGPLAGLRVYQLLNKLVVLAWVTEVEPILITRVKEDDYRANLTAMVAMCRESGAVPIIATAPSAIAAGEIPDFLTHLDFIRENDDLAELHSNYNDVVRQLALRDHVWLSDLDALFAERDVSLLFNDPGKDLIHPNELGYEIIANAMANATVAAAGKSAGK